MSDAKRKEYDEIPGLNYSSLKLMEISPAYYKHMADHPDEREDKPAYVTGRAVHCAILEPGVFDDKYVVMPDFGNLRTKAAREERDKWLDNIGYDVEVISKEDYDMAMRCADAIRINDTVSKMIDCADFEKTITWEMSGIKCKGRVDALTDRVIDLKTTRHARLEDVGRDFANFDYHSQLAWYHDGAVKAGLITGKIPPAAIVVHASHKSKFVDVAVLDMLEGTLEIGRLQYQRLLNKYIGCLEANWWPGMADRPVFWVLPDWKQVRELDD